MQLHADKMKTQRNQMWENQNKNKRRDGATTLSDPKLTFRDIVTVQQTGVSVNVIL